MNLFETTIKVNLDVNYCQFKEDFVFALMKCSYAAFGEQNKTDNDSKCQQVYKSLFYLLLCRIFYIGILMIISI